MTDNAFAPPRANLETQTGPQALWEMPFKELKKLYLASVNIRALGILYGLGAFGGLLAGALLFSGKIEPWLGFVLLASGVVSVAACISSYTRPGWGKVVGILLCVLSLLNVPWGTLIGILGLIAYANGGKLFGPDRLLHKDVVAVYKVRKKEKA
jgi:hypothetical protein